MRVVAVPRGNIYPEFQTFFPAGIRECLEHIAFTLFPRALGYGMVADGVRPKAETVVVLPGDYYSLEACGLSYFRPLPAVKRSGIEYILSLGSQTPFHSGESVRAEMAEHIHFHFLPGQLLR